MAEPTEYPHWKIYRIYQNIIFFVTFSFGFVKDKTCFNWCTEMAEFLNGNIDYGS